MDFIYLGYLLSRKNSEFLAGHRGNLSKRSKSLQRLSGIFRIFWESTWRIFMKRCKLYESLRIFRDSDIPARKIVGRFEWWTDFMYIVHHNVWGPLQEVQKQGKTFIKRTMSYLALFRSCSHFCILLIRNCLPSYKALEMTTVCVSYRRRIKEFRILSKFPGACRIIRTEDRHFQHFYIFIFDISIWKRKNGY